VQSCVVNGTSESDWPAVAALASRHPGFVIPSFGLHPWLCSNRSPDWLANLTSHLDAHPEAGLGECGLDRWIEPHDLDDQREVFLAQLELAARRNLPITVHCLRAWGPLLECLRDHPRPACGFLLHSYAGSAELVPVFAELGAYFSFSGHFLHRRKSKTRDAFRQVPSDRLLLETDAPDMLPPDTHRPQPLKDAAGSPLNHPANLPAILTGLAEALDTPHDELLARIETNFQRFFR
jgi:TatD DNase family protein